jgi:glycosyltransferase involved in cell wall biosynthesis
VSALQGTVIGFVGAVYEWVDLQLLEYVARTHPGWSIVLIGPIRPRRNRRELRKAGNIHLLGRRDYRDIHRYIERFDVCLLPFRSAPHMRFADPIVTYDYLLMGKPVVCTDFPQARRLEDLLRVEGTYDGFVHAIEDCLREDGAEQAMKRRSFAQMNSWDGRVRRIEQVIAARTKRGV